MREQVFRQPWTADGSYRSWYHEFDEETKRMYLAYYYPFSSPEMVQENTGFEIDTSRAQLMEGPDPEIIRVYS